MSHIDKEVYLSELIKEFSKDRNSSIYQGKFILSAIVRGHQKITKEPVNCAFIIQHNGIEINIMWEDAGYKNYRDMGLYGYTQSPYFLIDVLSQNSFKLIDKNGAYELIFEW